VHGLIIPGNSGNFLLSPSYPGSPLIILQDLPPGGDRSPSGCCRCFLYATIILLGVTTYWFISLSSKPDEVHHEVETTCWISRSSVQNQIYHLATSIPLTSSIHVGNWGVTWPWPSVRMMGWVTMLTEGGAHAHWSLNNLTVQTGLYFKIGNS
jgi:hypothetical protein